MIHWLLFELFDWLIGLFESLIELFDLSIDLLIGLLDLLFDILLDDDYDGSDAQIGAAYYISKLDKSVLKMKKEKLLQAQKNDVFWKRPFSKNDNLKWLNDDIAK